MKNKAFTLIELLAVIVILGIIMLIAITSVSNTVSSVKQKALDNQVKLILSATSKYAVANNILPSLNESKIITLKELQDNSYINTNIKNAKTGNYISDSTVIVIANNNGDISYNLGYTIDDLVLHYDGIYNGSTNIHNDNTSTNKGTWFDISGNGNDGVLNNINYTSTSGWKSNCLVFDGSDDYVRSSRVVSNMSKYTMEILFMPYTYRYTEIAIESLGFKWRMAGQNPYWNLYDNNNNPNSTAYTSTPNLNTIYSFTIKYDGSYASLYLNGQLNTSVSRIMTPGLMDYLYIGDGELVYGEIYGIRIYSRSLTSDEILNNYNTDHLRYNF